MKHIHEFIWHEDVVEGWLGAILISTSRTAIKVGSKTVIPFRSIENSEVPISFTRKVLGKIRAKCRVYGEISGDGLGIELPVLKEVIASIKAMKQYPFAVE